MKKSADLDQVPELPADFYGRAIVRRKFVPVAAGPDAPEGWKTLVRRAKGQTTLSIRNPNYKPRKTA